MDNTIDHTFESANRVYDTDGIAPAMNTCGGGGLQPKIIECKKIGNVYGEQYTGGNYGGNVWGKNGLAPCFKSSGSSGQEFCLEVKKMETNILGNLQPETKHQSQNVYDENGCAPTVMAGTHGYGMGYVKEQQIVSMRGRDKDNPSDRTSWNTNLEQRLEPNTKGTSNTITSVQKDNLVLEKQTIKIREANKKGYAECEIGGVADLNYTSSTTRRGRVQMGGADVSYSLCGEYP